MVRGNLAAIGSYWDGEVVYNRFSTSDAAYIDYNAAEGLTTEEAVAVHSVKYAQDFFLVLESASKNPDPASKLPYLVSFGDALRYVLVGEKFSLLQTDSARRIVEAGGADLRFMEWDRGLPVPYDEPPAQDDSDAIPTQRDPDTAP